MTLILRLLVVLIVIVAVGGAIAFHPWFLAVLVLAVLLLVLLAR